MIRNINKIQTDALRRALMMMTWAALLAGTGGLLSGCTRDVQSFSFTTASATVTLTVPGNTAADTENQLAPGSVGAGSAPGSTPSSPRYSVKTPVRADEAQPDFFISYRDAHAPLTLAVTIRRENSSADETIRAELPAGGLPSIKFLLPLPVGASVGSFQVLGSESGSRIEITGSGLAPDLVGVAFDAAGGMTIRNGIGVGMATSGDTSRLSVSLPLPRSASVPQSSSVPQSASAVAPGEPAAVVAYSYSGGGGAVRIGVSGPAIDGSSRSPHSAFDLHPQEGSHKVYFYEGTCGCVPTHIDVASSNDGFSLRAIEQRTLPEVPASGSQSGTSAGTADGSSGGPAPLPAGFGTIISTDPSGWRQKDLEIYSWELVPSVLVFDFRTLEIQSRFLKRLAFFVEKPGSAGHLLTNSEMQGLHGWNAHDYRPEDLARFFTTASTAAFQLNTEEVYLRSILVRNGIIKPSGSGYEPGTGAIIGYAHDGSFWLRYLLLTHEGYHGIYFTHPEYRDAVAAIWANRSEAEQTYWRLFLGVRGYNSSDDYLVVNEFEAYLMQQPVAGAAEYFGGSNLRALESQPEWKAEGIGQYLRDHPSTFTDEAKQVERAVRSNAGVSAGALVEITPAAGTDR